jgi:NAD(P)-dependent dehydrogenase (short-subunit alcohol dehydrogenase family)
MLDAGTARGASIVTIASIAAKHPDAGTVPYGVSKAGVWYLTKKVARELASEGIRVNAIGPGFIDTHMTAIIDVMPDERKVQFYGQVPMGRKGVPREIANTALFLASDESSYFTGEILHPDGGYYTE